MSEVVPVEELPQDGVMGVINRLKIKPKRTKFTVVVSDSGSASHYCELTYDYQGTLPGIGRFLKMAALDVFQAGGYVTIFKLGGPGNGLRPDNEWPNDYTPGDKWRAMHVEALITSRKEADDNRAAWDQAFRDLFSRSKQG